MHSWVHLLAATIRRGSVGGFVLGVVFAQSACAGALEDLAAILAEAEKPVSFFRGRITAYKGEDTVELVNQDISHKVDGLRKLHEASVWIDGSHALVEFSAEPTTNVNNPGSRYVGPTSPYNDLNEVLATGSAGAFQYLTIYSSDKPFANLHVFDARSSELIRTRLNDVAFSALKAFTELGQFPLKAVLVDPSCEVSYRRTDGRYILHAKSDQAGRSTTLDYWISRTGEDVEASMSLSTDDDNRGDLLLQSHVRGIAGRDGITPTVIARRYSGSLFGRTEREVVHIEAKDLEHVDLPVNRDFFRRYERHYAVLDNQATRTDALVRATPDRYAIPLDERVGLGAIEVAEAGSWFGRLLFIGNIIVVVSMIAFLASRRRIGS
ncbi:MAG: hypothetical protein ACOYLU_08560 [Limisphaerales bacterium]